MGVGFPLSSFTRPQPPLLKRNASPFNQSLQSQTHSAGQGDNSQPAGQTQNGTDPAKTGQMDVHSDACVDCSHGIPAEQLDAMRKETSQIDAHVRAHEAMHQAALGSFGGQAQFTYATMGPFTYVIEGAVPVSVPPINRENPYLSQAAFKAIKNGAEAPSDMSGADKAISAMASSKLGEIDQLIAQKEKPGQRLNRTV